MLRRTTLSTLTLLVSAALAGSASAAITPLGADWQMNEAEGTTLEDTRGIADSNATIGAGVSRATFLDGNRGFVFTKAGNIQVPHSADLKPGTRDVTLDIRVKPNGGGDQNVLQKGQYAPSSQMMKLEIVGDSWNCIFRGSNGDFRVGNGGTPAVKNTLIKGRWQTVQCVKTADRIALVVNGVEKASADVAVGSISTFGKPVTIGGKVNCTTHCDFFGGAVDYARVVIS